MTIPVLIFTVVGGELCGRPLIMLLLLSVALGFDFDVDNCDLLFFADAASLKRSCFLLTANISPYSSVILSQVIDGLH